MFRFVVYTILAVFLGACKVAKKISIANNSIDQISVNKVLNVLGDNNREFNNLYFGKAKFNVSTNQIKQNFTGTIRIINNNEIWITVNAFLGIEVAKLHFTKDSVVVKSNLEKKLYMLSYVDVYNKFGIGVDYETIESLLTYNFKFQKLGMYNYEYKSNGITLVTKEKYQHYMGYNNFTAIPVLNTLAVSDINYCSQRKDDCISINYLDFYNYGRTVVPNVLAISNSDSNYKLDILLGKESVSNRSESLGNVKDYKIVKP